MITTNLDIKHQKIYFWVVQGKQEGEEGKALGKLLQYDSSDQQKYKSQTKERFQSKMLKFTQATRRVTNIKTVGIYCC